MRALIIDDDLMARTALERLVSRDERLELAGVFEDAESALVFCKKNRMWLNCCFWMWKCRVCLESKCSTAFRCCL